METVAVTRPGDLDFFISHAGPDADWAAWIGQQLTTAGYTVELDVWDWAAGTDFVLAMERALSRARRMVAVFSPRYFERNRRWTHSELRAGFARQIHRDEPFLVPVLVDPCADDTIPEFARTLIRVEIVGLAEAEARRLLLAGVADSRRPAPGSPARFPGGRREPVYPASLPAVWNLPARNLFFTGREDQLARLEGQLSSVPEPGPAAARILSGIGGIGKSHLALEYAWRQAHRYNIVWWIDAEDPTAVDLALVELAARLGISGRGDTAGTVAAVLAALQERTDWLLVYDNVEDIESIHPPLSGHTVITSRDSSTAGLLDGTVPDGTVPDGTVPDGIRLVEFDRSESIVLLRRLAPQLSLAEAAGIAAAVADLPLSLAHAGAYLAATQVAPADYLRRIADARPDSPHAYTGLSATVRTALQELSDSDPAALDLLRRLAFLGPEPVPLTAVDSSAAGPTDAAGGLVVGDPETTRELVQAITQLDLARHSGTSLTIHRQVNEIVYDQIAEVNRGIVLARALRLLASASPGNPNDPAAWRAYANLKPHVQTAAAKVDAVGVEEPAAFRALLLRVCRFLFRSGRYEQGRALAEQAARRWRRTLGVDHPDTLSAGDNVASTLYGLGDYSGSRDLHLEVLAQRDRTLGTDHPDSLHSRNNVGVALRDLRDFEGARKMHADAWERRRRVLGDEHPDTLMSANGVAAAMRGLGDLKAAYELHRDTWNRRRRVLGENHPDTLTSAHSMVLDLSGLGDHATARTLAEDTLTRRRSILGHDHPDSLISAHRLTGVLAAIGDLPAAREVAEDAFTRCQRTFGEDHPHTLMAAHIVGVVRRDSGEHESARQLWLDTVIRRRRILGDEHPDTRATESQLRDLGGR